MATKPLHPAKVCTKCGIEKPHTSDIFILKLGKLTPLCRQCNAAICKRRYEANRESAAAYMKQYREENRESVLAGQRRYYREHIEERKIYDKAYAEANRDRRRKWHRDWSRANPDRIAFYNKRYQQSPEGKANSRKRSLAYLARNREEIMAKKRQAYLADPERHREYTRKWREENAEHAKALARKWYRANRSKAAAWSHHRRLATNTGEMFTGEDVETIFDEQDGCCTYCEADLSNEYEVDHFIPIAQGGGNEPENIVLACMPCNRSKGAKMPWEWRPDLFREPPDD